MAFADPEAYRAYQRRWAAENATTKRRESQRRHRAKNPEKVRARWAIHTALRRGKMVRGPCELTGDGCKGRIEAHHEDYSKPLDVRWLCLRHHRQAHKENPSL